MHTLMSLSWKIKAISYQLVSWQRSKKYLFGRVGICSIQLDKKIKIALKVIDSNQNYIEIAIGDSNPLLKLDMYLNHCPNSLESELELLTIRFGTLNRLSLLPFHVLWLFTNWPFICDTLWTSWAGCKKIPRILLSLFL